MVAIAALSTWDPGYGTVTVWAPTPDSHTAMTAAPLDATPLSFQQDHHLRTMHRANASGRTLPRLVVSSWEVEGRCDIAAMTAALNAHLRRHDTYHSAFDVTDTSIRRRTVDDPELIEVFPTRLGILNRSELRRLVESATPHTLDWDCFLMGVVQCPGYYTVFISLDHLLTDGMSTPVIYHDITQTYRALVQGLPDPLPPRGGYLEYSETQRTRSRELGAESELVRGWVDFVRETGSDWPGFPAPLGELGSNAGSVVDFPLIDGEQADAFAAVCRQSGIRFSGGVLACAALAERRFTGRNAVHLFTPSDTRCREAQSDSAGWFASLFPVSVDVSAAAFATAAVSAQRSFDANKPLSALPVRRAMQIAGHRGWSPPQQRPPMMVSLLDYRRAGDDPDGRLTIYLDELSHGDVNVWIMRQHDGLTVTVSSPATAEALAAVNRYVDVLRSEFLAAAGSHVESAA